MPHFVVTSEDIIAVSIVVHVCVLLELLANRMVGWLSPVFSGRSSIVRTLLILHRMRPGLLAKVIMEQTTLWSIIVIIMVALTYTSLSVSPFSHQPEPYPKFLIRVILNASIARFSVMATRIVLVRDHVISQNKTSATPGQSGHAKLDFIYCVYGAATNFLCLGYHENLMLGVTSSFMEVSSTPVECCRLIEQSNKASGSQSYRKTTILTCVLCFICRGMLPLLFVILAVTKESPFCMNEVPLVNFFISGVFYAMFNTLLLSQSIQRLRDSIHQRNSQQFTNASSPTVPFSIHMVSNETAQAKANDNNEQPHLNDFNYRQIHSSSNKTLYCNFDSDDVQKVNLIKKGDSKQPTVKKITKNSNGDILARFHFNSYTGRPMMKSHSYDFLLGSQDLISEKEAGMFVVGLDNESSNFEQIDIDGEATCEEGNSSPKCYKDPHIDIACHTIDMLGTDKLSSSGDETGNEKVFETR
ncbi:hypothetical protein BsWGS_15822 [Bradybaena similaris]